MRRLVTPKHGPFPSSKGNMRWSLNRPDRGLSLPPELMEGLVLWHPNTPVFPQPRLNDKTYTSIPDGTVFSGRALQFDGVAEIVIRSPTSFEITSESGTITITFSTTDVNTHRYLASFTLDTVSNVYLGVKINSGKFMFEVVFSGTTDSLETTETFNDGNFHRAVIYSTGSQYVLYIDSIQYTLNVIAGTNSGRWFSDVTGRNSISLGALKRIPPVNFIAAAIAEIEVWNKIFNLSEILFDYQNPEKLASEMPNSLLDSRATSKGGDLALHLPLTDGFSDSNYDTVLDISGNENHGTNVLAGAAWLPAQGDIVPQNALRSWSRKHISNGDDTKYHSVTLDLSTSFVISIWAYIDQIYDFGEIFGSEKHLSLITYADGHFAVAIGDGLSWANEVISSAGLLVEKQKYHFLSNYNGTTLEVFLDNVSKGTSSGATIDIPSTDIYIHRRNDVSNKYPLKGMVDELAVFNGISFNAAERVEIYNSGVLIDVLSHSKQSDLITYLRNTGVGNWDDLSGNGNDAIKQGTPNTIIIPEGAIPGKDGLGFPLTNPRAPVGIINLDGDSLVEVGQDSSIQPTTAITLAAWIKPESLPAANAGILITPSEAFNSGAQLYIGTDGKVRMRIATALSIWQTIVFDDVLTLGDWVFVIGDWDTSDDVIAGSVNNVAQIATGSAANLFYGTVDTDGKIGQLGTSEFPGPIGDTFIYNKRLSTIDRTNLFNRSKIKYGI